MSGLQTVGPDLITKHPNVFPLQLLLCHFSYFIFLNLYLIIYYIFNKNESVCTL